MPTVVKGSVYFLTETQAPLNYTRLEEDIIFRISPLEKPTMISTSYYGNLYETEDAYILRSVYPTKERAIL